MYVALDYKRTGNSEHFDNIKELRVWDDTKESFSLIVLKESKNGKQIEVKFSNQVKETIVTINK